VVRAAPIRRRIEQDQILHVAVLLEHGRLKRNSDGGGSGQRRRTRVRGSRQSESCLAARRTFFS
jgi:hypothetical protein